MKPHKLSAYSNDYDDHGNPVSVVPYSDWSLKTAKVIVFLILAALFIIPLL